MGDDVVNTQLLFSVDLSISESPSICECFAEKKERGRSYCFAVQI